ncbi:tRNA pseudouridine(38-40) synthase TruA [Neisseria sp. Ec49-e6-T10]|uniref:tRNA pseudouridine(38-40) synthase TruA n=1 Tax=Neisseria sp. Ec49-e6-T10 TaxID=3140744 RepID=UPI003EBCF8BA
MANLQRIALVLEYDGAAFYGWQRQSMHISVQEVLENALAHIIGEKVGVVAAGRTDTGVHALMQVVHFDSPVCRPITAWVRGVNAHLPAGVCVRFAQQVDGQFHARFDAIERQYRYVLLSSAVKPALLNGKVGWTHYPLDIQAMQQAIQCVLGEHDFSSFRASECQAKSPIKCMKTAKLTRQGSLFYFDFAANAFLHHMVRNLVGALVYVGAGRLTIDGFEDLLGYKNRTLAPPTFMPDGLYLTKVIYPEACQLALPNQLPDWFWGEK